MSGEQLDTPEMPMMPWMETDWDPDAMQLPGNQAIQPR